MLVKNLTGGNMRLLHDHVTFQRPPLQPVIVSKPVSASVESICSENTPATPPGHCPVLFSFFIGEENFIETQEAISR